MTKENQNRTADIVGGAGTLTEKASRVGAKGMDIVRDGYTVCVDDAELYVDNESRFRSGHMSHAMAEFAPNCFIDFNSNCSPVRCNGHSAFGWIEYRISRDSGKTYSDVYTLPYARKTMEEGLNTISVEKAVACPDGSIIAFCLRNDAMELICCEPYLLPPVAVVSRDGGETWGEPYEVCPFKGRIYDAFYYEGAVYFLIFCNRNHRGDNPSNLYRLYKSTDNGATFEEMSILPFDYFCRAYGAMIFDTEGNLHAYVYNNMEERKMDHAISRDGGRTWELLAPCYLPKGIRNPQVAYIDGVYILHGRGMQTFNFVLYTSTDATNWDEGTFIDEGHGFYSNNIVLHDEKGAFLLMQYSKNYELSRVNVWHRTLRIKRK